MLNQKDINVGIIGYGVIGQALKKWLIENTKCKITISDPPKGIHSDLNNCNIFFINIHIPTEHNGTQNLSNLENIIKCLPQVPIFIRTTILPGTSDQLSEKFGRPIYFMPEFLTERNAYSDFCSQDIIITGERELLDEIFKNKKRIYMTNTEAELSKYAHNVFGALKVIYFNEIYRLCQEAGLKYENISKSKSELVILNNNIEDVFQRKPNISKAKKVLNYNPSTPLDIGLKKTIESLKRKFVKNES